MTRKLTHSKSHSPGTYCVQVPGSGVGTADMRKTLLTLLAFLVWNRGDGSICNCSLGVLWRKSGDSLGASWRRSHFPRALENRRSWGQNLVQKKDSQK